MFDVSQVPTSGGGGLAPASAGMSALGGISSALNSAMPWGALMGGIGQALSTPPAGPSDAKSAGSIGTNLDNSGWSVTYGDNSGVDAVRNQSAPGVSASGGTTSGNALPAALGGINMQYVLLAVGAVVLLKVLRKKSA